MLDRIERFAVAEFDLCAAGPVIVGSGGSNETRPGVPDTIFLTGNDGEREAYVIPGSSIKGVVRHFICDNIKGINETELFGTVKDGSKKSRISFHDAYADMSTVVTNKRFSTALDQVLQNAKTTTLNNMETVEKGSFGAGFRLVNYTDAELAAVLSALWAIDEGRLRIGGRTSRGFGRMRIENFNLRLVCGYDEELKEKITGFYTDLGRCIREVSGSEN